MFEINFRDEKAVWSYIRAKIGFIGLKSFSAKALRRNYGKV